MWTILKCMKLRIFNFYFFFPFLFPVWCRHLRMYWINLWEWIWKAQSQVSHEMLSDVNLMEELAHQVPPKSKKLMHIWNSKLFPIWVCTLYFYLSVDYSSVDDYLSLIWTAFSVVYIGNSCCIHTIWLIHWISLIDWNLIVLN